MGISLSITPGHMANSVCRIRYKCKILCFSGCDFIIMTLRFQLKQYIRGNQEKLDQWMD